MTHKLTDKSFGNTYLSVNTPKSLDSKIVNIQTQESNGLSKVLSQKGTPHKEPSTKLDFEFIRVPVKIRIPKIPERAISLMKLPGYAQGNCPVVILESSDLTEEGVIHHF